MLQTEAGRELLQAATLAIAQEPPAPPDDAVANLAQYLRDLAALMPPLGQEDDKRAQLLRAAAALEAQGGATDKAYRKGRLDMWSELAAIDPALAETATELTSGYNLRRDENDGLQGQLREAQANLRAARARCDKLGPELDEMMRQRDLYTVERNAAHDLAAQLSLDAERYRWLREETSDLSFMFTLDKHGKPLGIKAREMLDEAIDTLRAALPKDPHA